ncbi:MAG: hypothetical protein D6719_06850 [Candidatus Dadabacteria bacterium]|nr:MAG: hypothetical protein D6719_06850 [Candidatus Dadabacteria bacterium]
MKYKLLLSLLIVFSLAFLPKFLLAQENQGKLADTAAVAALKEHVTRSRNTATSTLKLKEWSPKSDSELRSSAFKMFRGLGFCIGLLLIGVYLFKRLNKSGTSLQGSEIHIIEKKQLTAKTSLLLAEVRSREVLIAVGPEPVSICRIDSNPRERDISETLELICKEDVKLSA